ncbi:MAG: hypothetical protein ACXU86_17135 [Archangium sp.]
MLKSFFPVFVGGALLLTGCSLLGHFGYYKHEKAERAPPEQADTVKFPDSMDAGVRLTGPMMAALKVAMDEYRPPTLNPKSLITPEDRCLARWENINTTVLQVNENLFFVRFSPDLRNCAPGLLVPDSGAVYAIDGQGRVLDSE